MHQHPGEEGVGPCTLFYVLVVWCGVKFTDIEALWTGGGFYVAYNFITHSITLLWTTQDADIPVDLGLRFTEPLPQ